MTPRVLVFIFAFMNLVYFCNCDDVICPAWDSENVVPDVISYAPSTIAEITMPCGAKVETGEEMTLEELVNLPKSITYSYNPTAFYTFVMFDSDYPSESNPEEAQYVQWLQVNVDGQSALSNNFAVGDVLVSYCAPTPKTNTGKHHYIFLVFLQECELSIPPLTVRTRFNVEAFASENSLGQAIAGNFLIIDTDE